MFFSRKFLKQRKVHEKKKHIKLLSKCSFQESNTVNVNDFLFHWTENASCPMFNWQVINLCTQCSAMMKKEIIPKTKSVHFDTRTLCLHTMQLYWRQIFFRCISSPQKFYALVVILKADENTIQYHNNNSSGHLTLHSNEFKYAILYRGRTTKLRRKLYQV